MQVMPEPVIPAKRVPAADLGPTGDARPNVKSPQLFRGVPRFISRIQGPRAHQAHVACEDIPQLRQFVETGRTQKPAQAGDARAIRQRLSSRITTIRHRAELQDMERMLM